jgi:hypothetical protein
MVDQSWSWDRSAASKLIRARRESSRRTSSSRMSRPAHSRRLGRQPAAQPPDACSIAQRKPRFRANRRENGHRGPTSLRQRASRANFNETPPRERRSRANFIETTSWTPSQRIWPSAGQRRAAGPRSMRRDMSHAIWSMSHLNWTNPRACLT